MKRYDEWMLNLLLDRYEASVLYTGREKRNQNIAVTLSAKLLPEYFDTGSMVFDAVHEQLLELEEKGLVSLEWQGGKQGHILKKCILNQTCIPDCYRMLRRKPKRDREQRIEKILEEYRERNETMCRFCDFLSERMTQGKSVRQYVDLEQPEELEKVCHLVCAVLENEEQLSLREFSVKHFHDTKMAEKYMEKAAGIICRFQAEAERSEPEPQSEDQNVLTEDLSAEQLFEENGIYRNPSWIMVKGWGQFRLSTGACVDLSEWPSGIGISGSDLDLLEWKEDCVVQRVLTVENLTSFHQVNQENTLILYLGGYHNWVKCLFLQKIYQMFPHAVYEHFGDMDCGGFKIWRNLREKTGIPFEVYRMDLETFRQNEQYGRPLTKTDQTELRKMLSDDYYKKHWPLFEEMLKTNRKLEQECVSSAEFPADCKSIEKMLY